MALSKCYCISEYQDEKYGKDIRVYNETTKYPDPKEGGFRCTVCGRLKYKYQVKK